MTDSPTAPRPPHPTSKALVLCEDALWSKRYKRWTLVNVFTHWRTDKFPVIVPASCLYMQLVNADGDYQFTIDVRERKHDNTVKGLVTPVMTLHDRLRIHHLSLPFPRVEVPYPTTLDIVILTGGQEIDRQELTVFSKVPGAPDDNQTEAT